MDENKENNDQTNMRQTNLQQSSDEENPFEIIEQSRKAEEYYYAINKKIKEMDENKDITILLLCILESYLKNKKTHVDASRIKGLIDKVIIDELKNNNEFLKNCLVTSHDIVYKEVYNYFGLDGYTNGKYERYKEFINIMKKYAIQLLKSQYFHNNLEKILAGTRRDIFCSYYRFFDEISDHDSIEIINFLKDNKYECQLDWGGQCVIIMLDNKYFNSQNKTYITVYMLNLCGGHFYCPFAEEKKYPNQRIKVPAIRYMYTFKSHCKCDEDADNYVKFNSILFSGKIIYNNAQNKYIVKDKSDNPGDGSLDRYFTNCGKFSKAEIERIINEHGK